MSHENVEIVRRAIEPYEGEDLVPALRELVERVEWWDAEAVAAAMAQDPRGRHLHPEIEWDVSSAGAFGGVSHGYYELGAYWSQWVEMCESYVYRVREYRDLGDWLLTCTDVRARTRGGSTVEAESFQLWRVRDGKVSVMRSFLSEDEALEAAGLSDPARSQENIQLVRGAYTALGAGDFRGLQELVDPDVVLVDRYLLGGDTYVGHEGLRRFVRVWRGAWEEYRLEIEDITEREDRVVVAARECGRGRYTGSALEIRKGHVWSVRDGKILRMEVYSDRGAALEAVARRDQRMQPRNAG
jgi:uncharacterized protein